MPTNPTPFEAFDTLHAALYRRVVSFLCRFVPGAEAEDLAQEVFLRVHQGLPGFRGQSKVSTWVFQIATHLALDRLRSADYRQTLRDRPMEESDAGPSPQADPGLPPVQKEMCHCIRDMVSTLPLGYRTILYLSDLQDLTLREIAAILELTPGAAKIRLHRARQAFRQRMEAGCRFLLDERGELQCDPKGVSPTGSASSQVVKGESHGHHYRNDTSRQDPGGLRTVRRIRDKGAGQAHGRHGLRRSLPPG